MSKIKTIYVCQKCEYQSQKWIGKCPQCDAWNSFAEDYIGGDESRKTASSKIQGKARDVMEYRKVIEGLSEKNSRTATGIDELDRVLGSGIVDGSLILLSGEPGIGKSTLTLQICDAISAKNKKVLYISGEESESQIGLRGKRLGLVLDNVSLITENSLESIAATIEAEEPKFVIIDSIQVVFSENLNGSAGTVSQVRYCTEALMEIAKHKKISMLIVGHVTKEGNLAGPRALEHLVDVVLFLEGERNHDFRILRGI